MASSFLTVHCLVKNEQRYIWFALQSVLPFVDELLVWDDSSSDATPQIVNSLHHSKIKYRRVSLSTPQEHTQARQQMLFETRTPWFMILDGDEIWWWSSVRELISCIHNHPDTAAIITPFYNAVGDIYHHQPVSAVHYRIHHYFGAYTLRAINRRLPGLHVANPHGRQEYRTRGVALQNLPLSRLTFLAAPFLHLTHLHRSIDKFAEGEVIKRIPKYRFELGIPFSRHFLFPEVFYLPPPPEVPSIWSKRSLPYIAIAAALTPARWLKSRLLPIREGY